MEAALGGLYFPVLPPGETASSQAAFPMSLRAFDFVRTIGVAPEDLRIDLGGETVTVELPQPRRTAAMVRCSQDLGDRRLFGMTKVADLSCSREEKAKYGISAAATRFAWCSPMEMQTRLRDVCFLDAELRPLLEEFKDPDLNFLIHGGFIFLDAEKVNKVHSVLTLGGASSSQGSAAFGAPLQWLPEWTARIGDARFQPLRFPALTQASASRCAWIAPEEDCCGVSFGPHGGFACLLAGSLSKALPVVDNRLAQESLNCEKCMQRILRTFQRYDVELTGMISTVNLLEIFQRINTADDFPQEQLKRLMTELDKKGDGRLNYKDFLGLCYGCSVVDSAEDVQGLDTDRILVVEMKKAAAAVSKLLPSLPRVCILGGRAFQQKLSEDFVNAFADLCGQRLAGKVLILTGGMSGVQETFAKRLGTSVQMVHLLPVGESSNFGVGKDLAAGKTLPERIAIFGEIGEIYISVEGGPGVGKEATQALARGAKVIPVKWTGGASGGDIPAMGFPPAALERPSFASAEEWSMIQDRGSRSDIELVSGSAEGLVKLLSKLVG